MKAVTTMKKKADLLFDAALWLVILALLAVTCIVTWEKSVSQVKTNVSSSFSGSAEAAAEELDEYLDSVDMSLPGAETYALISAANGYGELNYANGWSTTGRVILKARAREKDGSVSYPGAREMARFGDYFCLKYSENGRIAGYAVIDIAALFPDEDERLEFIAALMCQTRPWLTEEITVTGVLDDDGFMIPSALSYTDESGEHVLLDRAPGKDDITITCAGGDAAMCLACRGAYRTSKSGEDRDYLKDNEYYIDSVKARSGDISQVNDELDWFIENTFGEEWYPTYYRYRQGDRRFAGYSTLDAGDGETWIVVSAMEYNCYERTWSRNWGYFAMFAGIYLLAGAALTVMHRKNFTFIAGDD